MHIDPFVPVLGYKLTTNQKIAQSMLSLQCVPSMLPELAPKKRIP
jgi:hypothetical protein